MQIEIDTTKPEVQNVAEAAALSDLQKQYRKFFRDKVKAKGFNSPFEGDSDEVADLFHEISEEWAQWKSENGITVA